jgi:hypothetical protein
MASWLALSGAGCATSAVPDAQSHEVRELTGAHTRVVWVQGDGSDPLALGAGLTLMGFDSDDRRGERAVIAEPGSYVKPLLTPSGAQIVYSARSGSGAATVFVVDWDGSNLRRLTDGSALAVWRRPDDGSEWVYAGVGMDEDRAARVIRLPIADPRRTELVWDRTPVTIDTFQLSADGGQAAGLFPWPVAGVATLPNRSLRKLGEGCWTALASVRGPLAWYFDGAHRHLTMVEVQTDRRWMVDINDVSGFDGAEVYHPRWANHSRFFAMTGPYDQGGDNQVRSGGPQVEVYLGRFSEDYTRVEAWARVTRNARGDAYPDVWVARDRSPFPLRQAGPVGPVTTEAGARRDGPSAVPVRPADRLVVEARLARAGPVPSPEAIAPYRHALVVNEYEVVKVLEGTLADSRIAVAQWAIRDRRVLSDARRTPGARYTLALERYDARPELEGERLVADRDVASTALFYDLGVR